MTYWNGNNVKTKALLAFTKECLGNAAAGKYINDLANFK
jgi:hypothetical protein